MCFLSDLIDFVHLASCRFHVSDAQTSSVHEGPQHLWYQTSGLVDQCMFLLNLFIKVSLLSHVNAASLCVLQGASHLLHNALMFL